MNKLTKGISLFVLIVSLALSLSCRTVPVKTAPLKMEPPLLPTYHRITLNADGSLGKQNTILAADNAKMAQELLDKVFANPVWVAP